MTEIRLHDTKAREKRVFTPADPQRVTMYVCGPTVYNRAHIGNARPAVVFDVLARLLRHVYFDREIIYARNVTDVDDKIIAAAEAEGVGYRVITERYYRYYMEDMGALGVLPPDFEPRATAFVPNMIAMIERLLKLGVAYEAQGHILFHVPSDPEYGSLSKRDVEAIRAGARVEVAPYKRDPADFVLWKPAGTSAEQVALSFDSPWGEGRPGWHIECSAMIEALGQTRGIGNTIDIHGGGLDLIFPHHENEIAQSRCAHHGAPLARYWVHNGFLSMAGSEKMSKSLGNVVTVADLLAQGRHGLQLRYALLMGHYRQPLEWNEKLVGQAQRTLDHLRQGYRLWIRGLSELSYVETSPKGLLPVKRRAHPSVVDALKDDLNTPEALAAISALAKNGDWESVIGSTELLGFSDYLTEEKRAPGTYNGKTIDEWVRIRTEAKARRDFAEADRIRAELAAEGIVLEDGPQGTSWRRA